MARLNSIFALHVIVSLVTLLLPGTTATSINVVNNCGVGGPVEFTGYSGITLGAGQSTGPISIAAGYSGRVSFNPLPSTLAEFSIATNNHDTFDISLVDGFNVGLQIAYTGGNCIRNGSPASNTVVCRINVNQCPPAYRNGDRCISPNRDVPTDYSTTVKSICPDAYSYSHDDASSTFTCDTGGDYTVTFCP